MSRNVLNGELQACSCEENTGCGREHWSIWGAPTICVVVTDEFLRYYVARGIDLRKPAPEVRGPGLRAGDVWCMGAARWSEARHAGVAPPVLLASTPLEALEWVELSDLMASAMIDEDHADS